MINEQSNENTQVDQDETSYEKGQAQLKRDNNESNLKPQAADESYMRLLAEFENFKKRTEKEQQYWLTHIKRGFLINLLPVLDDFQLALKHKIAQVASGEEQGISLIYKKLMQVLEKEGLKEMNVSVGDVFDTKAHEALSTIPSKENAQKDTIAEVVHQGYLLDHEIIRFAKVIVHA